MSPPQLTHREFDVLELVADGLSNEGIAGRLYLSPKTVESALSSVFVKLGLATDGRDGNRRVKAAVYFLSLRESPARISQADLTDLVAAAPFDTVVTVLEQRAADTDDGRWRLFATASWCLAISDDLGAAAVLAERARVEVDGLASGPNARDESAARTIVAGLTATLAAMRGMGRVDVAALDDVAALSTLPLRHHDRVVFDAMESVLEIANWLTFSDRSDAAAGVLDRRLYRSGGVDDFAENAALGCLGELDLRRGRWPRCDATLGRLLQRESAEGQPSGYAHAICARLQAGRGREDDARAHLRAARTAVTTRGDHSTRWRADAAEGLLLLGIGDAHGAATVLRPLVPLAKRAGLRLPSVRLWDGDLVEALVRIGDVMAAHDVTQALAEDVARTGSRWGSALLHRCHGLLREGAAATAAFEASATEFARLDAPFEQARSALLLGRLPEVGRAAEAFEALGAVPWLAQARRAAPQFG